MNYNDCREKVNRYLEDNTHYPLIINFTNREDFDKLLFFLKTLNSLTLISVSDYCKGDNNPQFDSLYYDLVHNDKQLVLPDYFTALRLLGIDDLKREFKRIVNIATGGKVVILTINCEGYLNFNDPKVNRRIVNVANSTSLDILPEIVFINSTVSDMPKYETFVDGIGEVFRELIKAKNKTVFVKTEKSKKDYTDSIYKIDDMKNAYRNLCHVFSVVESMDKDFGSEEQWDNLYNRCKSFDSIENYFNERFGNYATMDNNIFQWQSFDEYEKWEYILGLKLFSSGENTCIGFAVKNAVGVEDFVQCIYRSLCDESYQDSSFEQKYDIRKKTINLLGDTTSEAQNYCQFICYKGVDALYYLTDNTQVEKETIIKLLSSLGSQIELDKVKSITKKIYPDLFEYLSDYSFKNDFLNNYFRNYKYQKVVNTILPKFKELVERQAVDRDFYRILSPRSSSFGELKKHNSELVFFDALGVEYLSYIRSLCERLGLSVFVKIYRCDLPSLTSVNKDFVEEFKNADITVNDVKDLDEIKHKGKLDYDYNKVKEPIHLIKELEIIEEVFEKIKSKLINRDIDKVFVISDHGATRLAVINENTLKIEAYSKGEHGGRICSINEDVQPSAFPQATVVDDKMILANYDMFAGAKRATVEVHGGATLEEVTVPIIEVSLKDYSVKYEFVVKTSTIVINPNKTSVLELYCLNKIDNVSIKIEDTFYYAESVDYQNFKIELPHLASGKYYFDVYSESNLLCSGLNFEVDSGMSSSNDFMDSFDF